MAQALELCTKNVYLHVVFNKKSTSAKSIKFPENNNACYYISKRE